MYVMHRKVSTVNRCVAGQGLSHSPNCALYALSYTVLTTLPNSRAHHISIFMLGNIH